MSLTTFEKAAAENIRLAVARLNETLAVAADQGLRCEVKDRLDILTMGAPPRLMVVVAVTKEEKLL